VSDLRMSLLHSKMITILYCEGEEVLGLAFHNNTLV